MLLKILVMSKILQVVSWSWRATLSPLILYFSLMSVMLFFRIILFIISIVNKEKKEKTIFSRSLPIIQFSVYPAYIVIFYFLDEFLEDNKSMCSCLNPRKGSFIPLCHMGNHCCHNILYLQTRSGYLREVRCL